MSEKKKMGPPIGQPAPSWLQKRRQRLGNVQETANAEYLAWCSLNPGQRREANRTDRRINAAKIRVEIDSSGGEICSARDRTMVQQHGYRRHESKELANIAAKESIKSYLHRLSDDKLNFRKNNVTGCSVIGCPLVACTLLDLIQFDHILGCSEGGDKKGLVNCLKGPARDEELSKVVQVCVWHHYLHTRKQREDRAIHELEDGSKQLQLAQMKTRTGCQHPLHTSMSYATLVPDISADPHMHSFLHVSHIWRARNDRRISKPELRAAKHLMDLMCTPPKAYIHCEFCHRLWTLCENGKLYKDSPSTADRFFHLRTLHPAFVTHFETTTGWTDDQWIAEKLRIAELQSQSAKNRKRKPHPEDDTETNEITSDDDAMSSDSSDEDRNQMEEAKRKRVDQHAQA